MSRFNNRVSRLTQRGFSLVELIVASAIGLFVLSATFVAFQNSSWANRAATSQAQMAEDVSLAMTQMRLFISQAGYSNPVTGSAAGGFNRVWSERAIFGCDNGFGSLNATVTTQACSIAASGPDAIAVAFEADKVNSLISATNVPLDCLGNPTLGIGAPVTYYVSFNRFYVSNRQLFCRGYDNSAAQALVDNIEDMVISYGVSAASDGNVSFYTNAASVTNWAAVVSVRVCLLVRSSDQILAETTPYQGCDPFSALVTPTSTDKYLYRAYTMTVSLRNRVGV